MQLQQALRVNPYLKSSLLEGLKSKERELVLASATRRKYSAGNVISTQGLAGDRLFLLSKGCARFFYTTPDGTKILLLWMGPGDFFGGVALLAIPHTYVVSTEAVKDCEVLEWDRQTFRGLTERFPRLLDNALLIALQYIEWQMMAHVALSCHSARERLARILLTLSNSIGTKVADGIEIDVTNEDLASSASITLYTTSRLMSDWQKSRALIKRRGKVVLRSPERLFLKVVPNR
jgi:CRP-like cAMP-binding protein